MLQSTMPSPGIAAVFDGQEGAAPAAAAQALDDELAAGGATTPPRMAVETAAPQSSLEVADILVVVRSPQGEQLQPSPASEAALQEEPQLCPAADPAPQEQLHSSPAADPAPQEQLLQPSRPAEGLAAHQEQQAPQSIPAAEPALQEQQLHSSPAADPAPQKQLLQPSSPAEGLAAQEQQAPQSIPAAEPAPQEQQLHRSPDAEHGNRIDNSVRRLSPKALGSPGRPVSIMCTPIPLLLRVPSAAAFLQMMMDMHEAWCAAL